MTTPLPFHPPSGAAIVGPGPATTSDRSRGAGVDIVDRGAVERFEQVLRAAERRHDRGRDAASRNDDLDRDIDRSGRRDRTERADDDRIDRARDDRNDRLDRARADEDDRINADRDSDGDDQRADESEPTDDGSRIDDGDVDDDGSEDGGDEGRPAGQARGTTIDLAVEPETIELTEPSAGTTTDESTELPELDPAGAAESTSGSGSIDATGDALSAAEMLIAGDGGQAGEAAGDTTADTAAIAVLDSQPAAGETSAEGDPRTIDGSGAGADGATGRSVATDDGADRPAAGTDGGATGEDGPTDGDPSPAQSDGSAPDDGSAPNDNTVPADNTVPTDGDGDQPLTALADARPTADTAQATQSSLRIDGAAGPTRTDGGQPVARAADVVDVTGTDDGADDAIWRQVRRAIGSLRTNQAGEQQLTIRLRPAELGSVMVRVVTGDNGTAISLVAESAAAATQLGQQRQQLISELESGGLRGVAVDVGTSAGDEAQAGSPDGEDRNGDRPGDGTTTADRTGREAAALGYRSGRLRASSNRLVDLDL